MSLEKVIRGPFTVQGAPKKVNPYEKFYISFVVDIFTKFALLADEDSVHISCKFYYNNKCGSTNTTV